MSRLNGKVALVTGGASGIGAASARAIVREGGRVVIADLNEDLGADLANELGERARFTKLDVTDEQSWSEAVAFTDRVFGRLNVLVNSAGVIALAPLSETSRESWDRTLAINLTGPFLGIKTALPLLKRDSPSSVVNVSSLAGMYGVSPEHSYTASKFGVRGLTKSAAIELSDAGVRVNSVHPGSVDTPMISSMLEPYADQLAGVTDTRVRPGKPDEVASLILFLASDESSFSTGAEFVVDGGLSAGMKVDI